MDEITTIGIDLAKSIFQIHAVDASGAVVIAKAVRRRDLLALLAKLPRCLVGMEACASSHHWARELIRLGHDVRLIPPAYVKAYVRRQKNDAADAAAICEAVSRPSMRFVPVKSVEQQAVLMLHRTRALLVAQRTALICALRGHMAEFGVVAPTGPRNIPPLLAVLADEADDRLPPTARLALDPLARQMAAIEAKVEALDHRLLNSPVGLGGHRCITSLIFAQGQAWTTPSKDAALAGLRGLVAQRHPPGSSQLMAGVTSPHPQVVVLRVLSDLVEPSMLLLKAAWELLRRDFWGLANTPPRIWAS